MRKSYRLLTFLVLGLLAAVVGGTVYAATPSVIDFEGLSEGAVVSSLSSGNGVSGPAVPGSIAVKGITGDPAFQTSPGGRISRRDIPIAGTIEDPLYQTIRFGNFTYSLPVPNGSYDVDLHFAETFHGVVVAGNASSRVFDVVIEGVTVLDNYSIYGDVGPATATIKPFVANVADGELDIQFVTVTDNAVVSAIEVAGIARISAGVPYADTSGNLWYDRIDGPNAAVVFDATCSGGCSGNDIDLQNPTLGNILIIGENLTDVLPPPGDIDDPDDVDFIGSDYIFDFSGFGSGSVTVHSIDVIDVEASENEGGATTYLLASGADGTLLAAVPIPFTGSGGTATVDLGDVAGVDFIRLTLFGSGGIDNLEITPTQVDEICDDGIDNDGDGLIDEICPAIDIEKYVLIGMALPGELGDDADSPTGPTATVGSTVTWSYVVTNTGTVPLSNVAVTDDQIGAIACPQDTLAVAESMLCTALGTAVEGQYANNGTATGEWEGQQVSDEDPAHYFGELPPPPPPPVGGEGCTPGFWKNHKSAWQGYAPTDDPAAIFGVNNVFAGADTLLHALKQGGGGEKALGRHATAALLNAASSEVDYDLDVAGIIALVQNAYATGEFEDAKNILGNFNEQGCPTNGK